MTQEKAESLETFEFPSPDYLKKEGALTDQEKETVLDCLNILKEQVLNEWDGAKIEVLLPVRLKDRHKAAIRRVIGKQWQIQFDLKQSDKNGSHKSSVKIGEATKPPRRSAGTGRD